MIKFLAEFKQHNVMLSNSCVEDQHSAEGDVLSCGELPAGGVYVSPARASHERADAFGFEHRLERRDALFGRRLVR